MNTVSSYAILDAEAADVTANFTDVIAVAGTLTIKPAPLTVTTVSASKAYDGTGLTATATVSGLVSADVGKVTVTATGSQTAVGTSDNTYSIDWGTAKAGNYTLSETIGTLTVTANNTAIFFTAASAEKVYDGEALTVDEVTVEGLPAGFTYTATASGSQTEAGESLNNVSSYTILDAEAADVTANFTGVTTVAGNLLIKPAPLTITTDSASKVYDGTALTAAATISGLASADEGKITVTATGSQTAVGTSDNTYSIDWGMANAGNYLLNKSIGTLTVTVNDTAILFTAASAEKVYDGEALTVDEVTVEGLPAGFTYTAAASGSQTEAGESANTVSSCVILDAEAADVTANFTGVTTVAGTLTVKPAPLTVSTDSASKVYDGTALTAAATISGLISADEGKATVTATGSITDSGSTTNAYTIDWGPVNSDNYAITEELGTLAVTPAPLTVTTESADKVYDGTPLTASGTITGLVGSDAGAVTLNTTSMIINAGTAQNTYEIDWGTANPDNYEIADETLGTLTVEELVLNFSLSDVVMTYTTSLSSVPFPDVSLTYGNGEHMGENVAYTSRQYDGSMETGVVSAEPHFYTLFTGDHVCQYIYGMGQDVGEYIIEASINGVSGYETNMSNFSASCNTAAWTVTPRAMTIKTSSASKPYDGSPLTSADVTVSGLTDLDAGRVTVTATGSITDFGYADNSCTIDWGGVKAGNYTIAQTLGTLEITATSMPITVTSADAEGVYTPFGLKNSSYTVEGLPDGFTLTAEVTGTLNVAGTAPNTIASYTITDGDGADVKAYFTGVTLVEGTLTLAKEKIDIWSVSENFTYDGTWHSSHVYYSGAYSADNPVNQISHSNPATVRNAGNYEASFTVGEIRPDLQDRYELGNVSFGTIAIEPVQLSFSAENVSAQYSGNIVIPNVTMTFVNGSRAGETAGPSSTTVIDDVAILTYNLIGTDEATLTLHGLSRDAGTHSVTGTLSYDSAVTAGNYMAGAPSCTVTITPLALTISTVSETKVYDGEPLPTTTDRPTAVGFLPADEETVYVDVDSTSVTDAGSGTRGYTIYWNGVNENNYDITEDLGTLTVEPLQLTVDLHGKTYDEGSPYVPEDPTMTYANGSHAGEAAPGTRNGSASDVTFTLFNSDTIRVTVAPPGDEPGTYTLVTSDTCSGNRSNYIINWINRVVMIQ